ncbi:phosphoenolpyruvate-protein phosphotransferase [Peptococcaceae bacterium CEB3]|nr:phosphoenolpyruvate-protein phosphotransferase [Peptococcaceae bacterium CEB3]
MVSVVQKYYEVFSNMEDLYLRESAVDLKDISKRLVGNLKGYIDNLSRLPENTIIVADDLTPVETVQMDKSKIKAFLTNKGGFICHTAIIARTLEIPAVVA